MKRVRGKALSHQFESQGISIDNRIDEILSTPALDESDLWLPTNVLEAVSAASKLSSSTEKLASGNIRKTERIARDTPASALVDILNGSIDRWDEDEEVRISPKPVSTPESCPQAETYFLEAIEELDKTPAGSGPYLTRQVVHKDGRAVIFHKKIDIPTGLALEPITINGIPYPPGSIVAMKSSKPVRAGQELKLAPYSDLERLTFLRLSAFALRPDERKKSFRFDPVYFDVDPYEWKIFSDVTIGGIGKIVNEAVTRLSPISTSA